MSGKSEGESCRLGEVGLGSAHNHSNDSQVAAWPPRPGSRALVNHIGLQGNIIPSSEWKAVLPRLCPSIDSVLTQLWSDCSPVVTRLQEVAERL